MASTITPYCRPICSSRILFDTKSLCPETRTCSITTFSPAAWVVKSRNCTTCGRSKSDRNLARLWASTSHEVEVDKQGRMAIPSHLRAFAGLEGDVLVHGAIDRVELWNPTSWEQKVQPEEQRLTEGDDG